MIGRKKSAAKAEDTSAVPAEDATTSRSSTTGATTGASEGETAELTGQSPAAAGTAAPTGEQAKAGRMSRRARKRPAAEEPHEVVARGPWALAWRRLRKDKVAMFSGVVLLLIILVAIFAPVLAHLLGHQPNYQDSLNGLGPDGQPVHPGGKFLLGTDDLGRDELTRVIYGARVSLSIGLLSTGIAVAVGVVLGLIAGFMRGIVDLVIARIIDVVLSMPLVLTALALVEILGGGSFMVTMLVIAFFTWSSMARIIRGQVLSLREREFVEAARSLGSSDLRIMFVDILPNLVMPIIVFFSLQVPVTIVLEATLAYLNLGVPAPTSDWGAMLSEAQNGALYQQAPWLLLAPGAALLITTLAFNLLGDGVRDALDPRIDRLLKGAGK